VEEEEMILKPGDVIVRGKYRIVDMLGKGGFGEVYKARDTQLEREVAIKVIQRAAAGSTAAEFLDYEARFIQEARIGAQIRDENVIGVYAIDDHGKDMKVLVIEYAAGGSLATRIAAGPFTPEQTVELGIQVCKGLDAIHRTPVNGVHRDIKPTNILYDQLGRAKVSDLGLVQIYGMSGARSVGMGGVQPGTPMYMSPEQESETGYLKPASDIYSLGCVLFEALTRKVYQHLPRGTKATSLRPDVPAKLQEVLDKALAVEVDARYQDAAAMRQALEGVLKARVATIEPAAFQFRAGDKAQNAEEWAALADKHWEDGRYFLNQGSLETWLQSMNRGDLAAQVSDLRRKFTDGDMALEQVLCLLLPKLEQPQLVVDQVPLDFGQVERGQSQTVRFNISNPKRGLLYGTVKPLVPWMRVARPTVKCLAGQSQVVEVTLDSSQLNEGLTVSENALEIVTYSGRANLGGRVNVTWAAGLTVAPGRVNFGDHVAGETAGLKVQTMTVRNKGGGKLQGDITTSADWLAIIPTHFELESGKETAIQLTADPSRLSNLGIFSAEVQIASNAGNRVIPAGITYTSPAYSTAVRLQKWGLYLGLMLFVLAGWAVPLAFGLRWLLGLQNIPSISTVTSNPGQYIVLILEIAGLFVWLVLAWVTALVMPRFLLQPLDEIENFYHRGNLETDIPGRRPAFLRRLLFGLLVGGVAAGLAFLLKAGSISLLPQEGLRFTIPMWAVAGVAGFLFGWLIVNSRPAGKDFTRRDRLWAAPRALLVAGTFTLLLFSISKLGTKPWDMIWMMALGLVLAGDNFTKLPLRLYWLYARIKPVLPGLILIALFFFWARFHFLSGMSLNLAFFYGLRTNISLTWYKIWPDLGYLLAVLVLGWLGLLFNNAREDGFRRNASASIAALLLGGIPALFGFMAVSVVSGWLKSSGTGTSVFGVLGMMAVIVLAALALWLAGGRRQWLKRALNAVFTRVAALLAKIPALARRSNPASLQAQKPAGLADYLTGNAAIPATASLMALVMIIFNLPATFGVLKVMLQTVLRVGLAVFLVLLCLLVPGGLAVGAYLLWKRSQQKK
jgi:serine/threonine protein kinase